MVRTDDWSDFQKYVYEKLEANAKEHQALVKSINQNAIDTQKEFACLRERTAKLEVKSTIWGMLGGMLSSIGAFLLMNRR